MKKIWLAVTVLMVGCSTTTMQSAEINGGALCQGSRAWQERNVCGLNNTSGLCIKAVDGPAVIQEIKSSENCPHMMWVGIKDSWSEPGENSKPRWEMQSPTNLPLHIKDSSLEVHAGESLFIGTIGHNAETDSSRCYVTWTIK